MIKKIKALVTDFIRDDIEQFRDRFEESMIAAGKTLKLKRNGEQYADTKTQLEWESFAENERQQLRVW
ncbi:hypothetical protein ACIOV9_03195 [Pseudomonas iridis]|uniref:hypothetical protein n=1 Tax=Pseudomonas iridis TaxID=2710587 RepID=UPI00382881FB